MYRKQRLVLAGASVIFFILYVIALFIAPDVVSDSLSGCCGLTAALSVGLTSFINKKYRVPISIIALGPVFWVCGDIFYVLCDTGVITEEHLFAITDPMYRMTTYTYCIGLLVFGFVQFTKRDLLRLFVNAFLSSIATAIISVALFQLSTNTKISSYDFGFVYYFRMVVAMFIIVFFLVIATNHTDNKLSLYGLFVLASFFIYGVSDIRYTMLEAAGEDPSGIMFDAIYLSSMVLLGIAYATSSIEDVMETQDRRSTDRSGASGILLTVMILLFGVWLCMTGALSILGFLMLMISGVAYLLLLKLLKKNDANENIIAKKEEELSEVNEKLANASVLDIQTGLRNRRAWNLYRDELKETQKDSRLILYSLDINFFKMINDTYGTSVADQLLAEIGRRLLSIEEMGITAFRLDGDQFMILCVDEGHEVDSARFADYLIGVLDRPYETKEKVIRITFSIGAAMYPDDTPEIDRLMSCAESVRTSSNPNGNASTCAFFDASIIPKIQRENLIENLLQNLDYEEALELFYQPQVNTQTGELIGMEALLRWKDEDLGYIPPSEFIPIAENMGIMPAMGEWIVHHAFMQIIEWNQKFNRDLKMSINISPKQLQEEYFTETFFYIMKEMDVNPAWIDVEVTESIALNNIVLNTSIISNLRETGLSVSVDDFGTGYAAFANMLTFKFDRIKLAKELIDSLTIHTNAKIIVEAIVNMAKGMHLITIAEGVEEKEQLDILKELDCDQIQGFYFGKPIPAKDFEEKWLKS